MKKLLLFALVLGLAFPAQAHLPPRRPALEVGATKFTASGCSNGTTVGDAMAGTFVSGTTGTCTVVITINGATGATAPHGWNCFATNRTTVANPILAIADTVTTCTIEGTTVSGDVIQFSARPY